MQILGIDIGGTGIKFGIVDTASGTLLGEKERVATPRPATPEAVGAELHKIVETLGWRGPIGIGFPAAIVGGKVRTASNIDKYLGGTGELNKGEEIEIPVIEDTEVVTPHNRFRTDTLSTEQRRDNFCEVACGFHRLDAMAESLRCLHCDRR